MDGKGCLPINRESCRSFLLLAGVGVSQEISIYSPKLGEGFSMRQRSRPRALLRYLGASFAWLVVMTAWVLVIVPYVDPLCYTSASFGFLPAAIVVPFLMLPLYLASVAIHAVFAFYQKRFDARQAEGVPLFGLDALFFVPFTVMSLIAFMPATH